MNDVTLRNQTEVVSGLKTTEASIAKLQLSSHGEITLRPDPVLEGDHDPILDYAQYEVDEFSLMIGALETQFDLTD